MLHKFSPGERISACAASLLATTLAAPANADMAKLEFVTFNDIGVVEQDVFAATDGNKVKRVAVADVAGMMDAPLYAATESPPFDPMTEMPTDTYGMGPELGVTMAEWLAAEGSGSYECVDGKAVINADFTGLRPDAVYTMWNYIDASPPTSPWQGLLFPLGARDGSDATFHTDGSGNATYSANFEPCLQASGTQTLAGIAAAWHIDGKTYGKSPGALGVVSATHLMVDLVH